MQNNEELIVMDYVYIISLQKAKISKSDLYIGHMLQEILKFIDRLLVFNIYFSLVEFMIIMRDSCVEQNVVTVQ